MKALSVSILLLLLLSCTSGQLKESTPKSIVLKGKMKALFKSVEKHNTMTSPNIYATFSVFGKIKNKKFKSFGLLKYSKETKQIEATFKDVVFYSVLTQMFIKGNDVIVYFPVDKTVIIDKMDKINLRTFLNMSIPLNIITELTTGKIPLLKNYRIKKALKKNDSNAYLILENRQYYEVISFKNNRPDKIKIVNKFTREEYEIYLKKLYSYKNRVFYKNILIKAIKGNMYFSLKFNRISFPGKISFYNYTSLLNRRGIKIRKFH